MSDPASLVLGFTLITANIMVTLHNVLVVASF